MLKKLALNAGVAIIRLVYLPIKLLPRRNKVTMISRQSNKVPTDFVLLEKRLKELKPEVEVEILAKEFTPSIGYCFHMLKQMHAISTSKVVALDSYCIPISVLNHKKGLNVIQMWHSMGLMKAFGFDMLDREEGRDSVVAEALKMHRNYNHILISSLSYLFAYEKGFHADPKIVRELPLPRTDLLTDREYLTSVKEKLIKENPSLGEKENIVYAPTFRGKPTPIDEAKIKELIDSVDYSRYNLIYKPHPVSKIGLNNPSVITSIPNNISAAAVADYLISDYSSVIYEFGLAGVPVYLYGYDWEEYKNKRTIYLDPEKEIPAFFSNSAKEVLTAIDNDNFDEGAFKAFLDDNVVVPKDKLCVDKIIDLMGL